MFYVYPDPFFVNAERAHKIASYPEMFVCGLGFAELFVQFDSTFAFQKPDNSGSAKLWWYSQATPSAQLERMDRLINRWLPRPRIYHSYPDFSMYVTTLGRSPVREIRSLGSVRGVRGNSHPYRDQKSRMPQILGVEGEAVVLYREPSTTQ